MRRLEDEIDTLIALDKHRERARELLEQGMESLAAIDDNGALQHDGEGDSSPTGSGWHRSTGRIEAAMLVRVQNKHGQASQPLMEALRTLELGKHLLTPDPDRIPVLLAARAMQALIASSEETFSRSTLLCYYRIIREIYVADSPDWSAGGARAGAGGEATAYVTGECIRAILMLARTLRNTAAFFQQSHRLFRHSRDLERIPLPREWKRVESERAALESYISVRPRTPDIALHLPRLEPDGGGRYDLQRIQGYFTRLAEALRREFEVIYGNFKEAEDIIQRARAEERPPEGTESGEAWNRYIRSESGHQVAMDVIRGATRNAEKAREIIGRIQDAGAGGIPPGDAECDLGDSLEDLARLFYGISSDVRKLLEPAKRFVGSILDHELTAATQEKPVWDVREMAFAAGAYGAATDWGKDERLVRACRLLAEALSEDGMFTLGRPFHSVPKGLRWQTLQFEVCRSMAELLQNVDMPVDPRLVQRMLHPFEHNVHKSLPEPSGRGGAAQDRPRVVGWHMEDPPVPRRPAMWVSALALLALDKLARMLDGKINDIVLSHFSVKRPAAIADHLALDRIFYPDFGRRLFAVPGGRAADEENESRESIGITLQRMRAHIVGCRLPPGYAPEFSTVLHGPPGTGKTTLLEALAKSSDVPLVELSPSDIAQDGEEAIERRARVIFHALSMLTRAVIILDEFEPVLRKREDNAAKEERSLFTFLTPGMLPKLTRLHDSAEKKQVAYCLVTNHLGKLDDAAVRPGRFDRHVGIYKPDPVSRAGRFLLELCRAEASVLERVNAEPPDAGLARRFEKVIRTSGDIAPSRLFKRWFSRSAERTKPTPWNYVLNEAVEWMPHTPPVFPLPTADDGKKPRRYVDLREQDRLQLWEKALAEEYGDFDALLNSPEPVLSEFHRQRLYELRHRGKRPPPVPAAPPAD